MWLVKRQSELQVRDPRAATIPLVQNVVGRRYSTWNAEAAVNNGLYQNIYVYACARARAQDLSALPIRVGADPDNPKDFDPNHPLAKLLGPAPGGPTMNLSARKLVAWSSIQFDISGRFGWEIAEPVSNRRDGVPFELWPLAANKLHPIPSMSGAQWFSGYEYEAYARRVYLKPEQVLYYWRPKADDFRDAESLLEAARLNVSIAVMQDKYDFAFLQNDARPAAVVVHEAFEEKEERDGFRRQFLDSHRGPDNAGKVAFVETSVDGASPADSLLIQNLGLSQRDAEFIERYENQIRAICVAFATPLSRLADSSRRTYANAERETLNYWRNAVVPQAVEMAEAINVGLMPLIGDSSNVCWFDTTGIPELEPPARFAVSEIPELLAARVITRNEGRHAVYLPPVEGGDEFVDVDDNTVEQPPSVVETERARPSAEPVILRIADQAHHGSALLAQRVFRALDGRVAGKRGRQAEEAGAYVSDLFDPVFWHSEAAGFFRNLASTVALAYDAHEGVAPADCDQWAARWGDYLADQWVRTWQAELKVPVKEGQYNVGHTPVVDIPTIRALWLARRETGRVSAEKLQDCLLALEAGEDVSVVLSSLS